jgi:crotonobetainyl-CoA:carnitine CoA-transferase CaiB-like acyl-CoA transferase
LTPSHGRLEALVSPASALADIWSHAALPTESLDFAHLTGAEPTLPSSFAISTAAQSSIAAAALAAAELRHVRGHGRQHISVDMRQASAECTNFLSISGIEPEIWDKLSGLYPCGQDGQDGWVRIHANFKHHRDGALRLLGCPLGEETTREQVTQALRGWNATDFESAAADSGLVVAALRTFDAWDRHPQGQAVAALPLLTIEKLGEAAPIKLPALDAASRPLSGVRCLDLTRILAGPVGGRTLAAYGADVLLVNAPHLPNIHAIAETSRGKLSAHVDLRTPAGQEDFARLLRQSQVVLQGYRPGGLEALGFGAEQAARMRPGIVYVSLSAYSHRGPWAGRRGFDSLVQTATGFNHAEGLAAGSPTPKALPVQILDHASGYLMAFGAAAALARQQREGGSWHVRVSLAQTGNWLRELGRQPEGLRAPPLQMADLLETYESGFGKLVAVGHSARFSETPAQWTRPSMPPGSSAAVFPPV